MQAWDKTNTGVVFKVEEEKIHDWHADYKGSVNIEGEEYWCDLWKPQRSKDKTKQFIRMKFRKKGTINKNQEEEIAF